MQTFLPYPDFEESARVLDNGRLNKQTVEVLQIMKVLVTGAKAWGNHPAVRMWRGYESTLYLYQVTMVAEWEARGKRTVCLERTFALYMGAGYPGVGHRPPWLGDPAFHLVHQANLIRKDPAFYAPKFPAVIEPAHGYLWPVDKAGELKTVDMRRPAWAWGNGR